MNVAIVGFLSFLGGSAVVGLVVFLVMLFRVMTQLRHSMDAITKTLNPKAIEGLARGLEHYLPELTKQVSAAAQAFGIFANFAFVQQKEKTVPAPGQVSAEASGWIPYDEELMAKRQQQEQIKEQLGVETREEEIPLPATDQFVGTATSPFTNPNL